MASKPADLNAAIEKPGGNPQAPPTPQGSTTETKGQMPSSVKDGGTAPQENPTKPSDEAITFEDKVDAVARKIMESINPSFFEKQRDLLLENPKGPVPVSPAITTLFHSPSEAVQILRVLGIGSCKFKLPKEGKEERWPKSEVMPNPYLMWSRGSSTPTAERSVPLICIVSREKGDERVATFTLP